MTSSVLGAHNSYRRRSDLARLLTSVRRYTGKNPLEYRYVMDKVVGCQHAMGANVLSDRRTRYVFLVREPLATIASIVAMRRQMGTETSEQLIAYATEHYRKRLAQLVQLAETIDDSGRCLLLTHQQLLAETPQALAALEAFLSPACRYGKTTWSCPPLANQASEIRRPTFAWEKSIGRCHASTSTFRRRCEATWRNATKTAWQGSARSSN